MSLKGWVKKEYGNGQYALKDSFAQLGGHSIRLDIKKVRNNYNVYINTRGTFGWNSYKKGSFKSKSEAIKFAKEYMKKH